MTSNPPPDEETRTRARSVIEEEFARVKTLEDAEAVIRRAEQLAASKTEDQAPPFGGPPVLNTLRDIVWLDLLLPHYGRRLDKEFQAQQAGGTLYTTRSGGTALGCFSRA
jgi:hypothetical protein